MYLFILSRDIYTGQPDKKILPAKKKFVCFFAVFLLLSCFSSHWLHAASQKTEKSLDEYWHSFIF